MTKIVHRWSVKDKKSVTLCGLYQREHPGIVGITAVGNPNMVSCKKCRLLLNPKKHTIRDFPTAAQLKWKRDSQVTIKRGGKVVFRGNDERIMMHNDEYSPYVISKIGDVWSYKSGKYKLTRNKGLVEIRRN